MRRNKQYYTRKIHRWLGLIIGVQFILWTVSGLYFSWTDIDEIHGDQFLKDAPKPFASGLIDLSKIDSALSVNSLVLKFINGEPYYWINERQLIHAKTGELRHEISEKEAIAIANEHVADQFKVEKAQYLSNVNSHHEYRGRPLPAWAISYAQSPNLIAYVSARDGSFQRVRHRSWRWFDFLWMTHTMDYESRDDMNNWLLRAFSAFGLLTVISGFTLFFMTMGRMTKKKNGKN